MSHSLPSRGAAQVSMIRTQLQQAEQLLKARQLDAAASLCRTVLALDSRNAPALQMLGISLAQQGDHAGAETAFRQFLKVSPNSAAVQTNLGNIYHLRNDNAGAEACYRKAIAIAPNYVEAHFNLGLALKTQGKLQESLAALKAAISLRPGYIDAIAQLGIVQMGSGDPSAAIETFDKVLAIQENHFEAQFSRGLSLAELGRLEEAKHALARAGALNQDSHKVFLALGQTLHSLRDLQLATSALARAATLKPDDAETHAALASVFLDDGWTMAALDEIEKAAALDANSSFVHVVKGRVLAELNRLEEAQAAHERAVELAPDSLEALTALGSAHLSTGESAKAREAFEKARSLHPDDPRAFLRLIRLRKFKSMDDPQLPELEQIIREEDKLSPQDRITMHYAAGAIFDELNDVDRSFVHFNKANKIQADANTDNEEQQIALQQRVMEVYTPEFIRSRKGMGSSSSVPILVFGMPRSGTTLSEQIISSHPQVQGAGEVLDLDIAIRILVNRLKTNTPMPELTSELQPQDLAELGDIYANRLTQRAPGTPHVTDKTLSNFNRVGLLNIILPNAKLIHCMRNPIDCCVSIYTNHFQQFVEHANDMARLGRFYRRYHELMNYWRTILPPGAFLDVQYEDTVEDLETQARRIIAHCGLEWDPRCLDFQNNKRQVTTLSITQVRQPIYKSSVERWRRYEKHLGPLIDALGDLAPPR